MSARLADVGLRAWNCGGVYVRKPMAFRATRKFAIAVQDAVGVAGLSGGAESTLEEVRLQAH